MIQYDRHYVHFFISIVSSAPSASDEDYIKTAETIVLSAKITEKCFTILLIDDAIVEMNETFLVKLEQNVTSEDLIFRPNPEYTEVIIEDNDGRT